ncbi:MAG TPA: magnesium/cobalt transporter CorA [Zoogloea sp.]|uniref:magnesium/cobalt transporter CorA n=1 Tax=Zoogloea sp. TaxID=49181 RepID=UPI002D18DFF9|nr:magnesium/cobalt transporter CorA [Zoogloea sp.]HOB45676.1 magnesium/cobalt transporter CorA [Zoogloea sp.]HQA09885.1 magnesium/cobalt transporter CorA [Zoogloea sp.]HQE39868.1 magnesium/cobalt transporter CorA [Zoogloea sp.]
MHIGEIKTAKPNITLIEFDAHGITETRFDNIEASREHRPTREKMWLNVYGLHDPAVMAEIGRRFKLHPLVQEDILNTLQRPKSDEYADYLFIVARCFDFDTETRSLTSDQVSIVLGHNFVLTFQERATGAFEAVRERLRAETGAMKTHGTDYLAYALLDTLVDRYFVMLDNLADMAEELQDEALNRPNPSLLAEINRVKHEALLLRRAVWPLREILNLLARADNGFFTADTRLYLRDIYDHTVHVLESLESVRDLLADLLDIYLSSVSNRLNTEVRILTVLTTLFMPATLIAGIFGMNFQTMPLLDEHDGFWIALATMLGAATVMAAAFWRRNWLRTK